MNVQAEACGNGISSARDLFVVMLDAEGHITQVSPPPASAARWADDGSNWIGRHLYEVFVPYGASQPDFGGDSDDVTYSGTYTAAGMLRQGVTAFSVRTVALPDSTEPQAGYVTYLRPLWAPKPMEAQKPAETDPDTPRDYPIHRVAGGLAHDINNALFIIIGLAEEMLDTLEDAPEACVTQLRAIMTKAKQAGDKSHQVLRLMDVQRPMAKPLPVQALLEGIVSELALTLPQAIHVLTRFEAPAAVARIFEQDLGQVLEQCFNNAVDAMPDGGSIEIGLKFAGEDSAHQPLLLWVEDSGRGMSEDVLARCQEPYYSTREKPGLGLAIVKALARGMRAPLSITAMPGAGTRVQLEIPAEIPSDGTQQ